ncbi:MAG: hypothetical protein ABGZ53_07510 [Fuerstiella sp.]
MEQRTEFPGFAVVDLRHQHATKTRIETVVGQLEVGEMCHRSIGI